MHAVLFKGSAAEMKGGMVPGKRIQFDTGTLDALDMLAADRMMDFQELADEAFRDLLEKHGRPIDLKDALRKSVRAAPSAAAPKKRAALKSRKALRKAR